MIPWEDVALDTGTGIVHIAPGAGPEDFVLSTVHDLPVLAPVDEAGRFYPDYGWLAGMSVDEARAPIIDDLAKRGLLVEADSIVHAYPHCWRCDTPLIFRVADDWLIAVDGVRQQLLDENAKVEWTPAQYGKRMDDWLRNMEDWNISRRRYYGLPLPFYPCTCGHLNVIGSRAELEARAVSGLEAAQGAASAVDRRGGHHVRALRPPPAPHPGGGRRVAGRRHRPVLHARLAEREFIAGGLRHRRGEGPDEGRPARPRATGSSGSPPTG